ncbi:hypothetical protein FLGSB24_15020 [Flavobacterium sp. GSB-24]|nr:hypothetical protein FLGSB24_15020 [Flavobacterium sp. GSB-24]
MQYPPTAKTAKVLHLNGCSESTPNKYPAIEENKTLIANPALVISLKSRNIDLIDNVFFAAFNTVVVCVFF